MTAGGQSTGLSLSRAIEQRASIGYRWGAAVARHARAGLVVWFVLLALSAVLYPSLQHALGAPDYGVGGSQSRLVEPLLARFPGQGDEQDVLVFHGRALRAHDPQYRAAVMRALTAVRGRRGVLRVLSPYAGFSSDQISRDGHSAAAAISLVGDARHRARLVALLQLAVQRAAHGTVHAWLTGYSPIANDLNKVESADIERAEEIGIPLAFCVLLLALGSLAAAAVPLLMAASGLLLTYGALALLSSLFSFDIFLLTIVTMIGVGIGIDYSLFVVARFREELASTGAERGGAAQVREAVAIAVETSGCAVFYSGAIVALALGSLLVVDSPVFREIAVGTVTAVACTLAAALTLLPALLTLLGERLNSGRLPARMQPPRAGLEVGADSGWARWAMLMMRRPLCAALLPAAVLMLAALPAIGLRDGIDLGISSLAKTPSGQGARLLARSFASGAVSPLEVLLDGRGGRPLRPPEAVKATLLAKQLEGDARVAGLAVSGDDASQLITVVPSVSIDSPAAGALVREIRGRLARRIQSGGAPNVLVGGATAQFVDFSSETDAKLPLVLALVLGLSLLFLAVVLRSIVLPVKAVLMNLLATGAAVGLVVLVFQDGGGGRLLGFASPGYIQVYLPLTVFVLLFGLSMDYEMLMVLRMRESWRSSGDNRLAVAAGVAHTARPIAAAAGIMVAVFGSFLTANVLELKEFGFALAVAIALDATLVRLMLVPALMRLLGARNWWFPASLARALARVLPWQRRPDRGGAESSDVAL
jgi:RND superfamily putative drug exporter